MQKCFSRCRHPIRCKTNTDAHFNTKSTILHKGSTPTLKTQVSNHSSKASCTRKETSTAAMETCAAEKNPQRDCFLHICSNACSIFVFTSSGPEFVEIQFSSIPESCARDCSHQSGEFCTGPLSPIQTFFRGTGLTSPGNFPRDCVQ